MQQNANAWIRLGREKLREGNYSAALVFFDQALTLDPENADAWKGRATALQELGSIQEMLSASDHAIAEALCERGRQLEAKGDYAQAIKSYDQALAVKPEFEQAKQSRSKALKNLQSADFSSFVLLRPSSSSILANDSYQQSSYAEAEDLRRLGRYEAAIPNYTKAIQLQLDDYRAYAGRGNALRKLGLYEEAILDLNKAIELQSDYYIAYYYRGDINRKLGHYQEAIFDFNQVIKLQSGYYNAYNGRGNTYRELGLYEEAISDFNKAIELQPNNHLAYNNRGSVLRKLGQSKEAIFDFKKALKLSENKNWRAWVNWGWTYFQDLKSYQSTWETWNQGLQKLESLKQIQPQNPEYQRGCGELHWCKGKAHYRYQLNHSESYSSWDEADKSYELALKTLTFERFPVRHLEVWQDLIQDSQYLKDPDKVEQLLSDATDLLRRLLEETQSESAKISLSRKFASFDQMGVDVLVQKGKTEKALKLAEKRKNTCLAWFQDGWSDEPTSSPNVLDIQKLLNSDTAAIYWHVSPVAITTFILKHNQPPLACLLTANPTSTGANQQLHQFEYWLKKWHRLVETGFVSDEEKELAPAPLHELANILDIPAILSLLEGIPQLILIPHRDLHLLPLHALFPDDVTITYLPSLQIGLDLQRHTLTSSTSYQGYGLPRGGFLSIEHPQAAKIPDKVKPFHAQSLLYSEIESAAITYLYPAPTRLRGTACTLDALLHALNQTSGIFHFTGHAYHNLDSPANSALLLANTEQLTLRTLFEKTLNNELNFSPYHLICLSACETGKTGKQGLIDEFVGLASGFLAAGVPCVVSTLWRVNEITAALLMIRFYELIGRFPPTLALNQAQQWLREATYSTLADWCRVVAKALATDDLLISQNLEDAADDFHNKTDRMEANHCPYAHPYYWAAFTISSNPTSYMMPDTNRTSDAIALEALQTALQQLESPLPEPLHQDIHQQLNYVLANPETDAIEHLIQLAQKHDSLYQHYRKCRKELFNAYQAKPKNKGYTPTEKETPPTTSPTLIDNTVAPTPTSPNSETQGQTHPTPQGQKPSK